MPAFHARRLHGLWARAPVQSGAASGTRTLFVNGKFAAQRTTGVQRVARSLLIALDEHEAEETSCGRIVLLVPQGASAPPYRRIETRQLGDRALPLHVWEQCLLPWASRGGLLLNLAGSAPLLAHRQACLIHDAAVFDRPQAYSAAFALWYRTLFRLLARRRVTLLTVSAFSQRRLAERLGIAPSRIGIVPGGGEHLQQTAPDASVLAKLGLEPGRYLMAVGSANANKNFPALEAAFTLLPAGRDIKLVTVGGTDPGPFAPRPADARVPTTAGVVRAGTLDDGSLRALYQHAAGLVFPSLYEGFGLPPLEAMSCGCPVAASNAAAVTEVCGDAVLYFDPASTEQIAAAMHRLIADAPLRERLQRAGTEQLQRFRWDLSATALQSHLKSAWSEGHLAP